jgi:hypothetical protein
MFLGLSAARVRKGLRTLHNLLHGRMMRMRMCDWETLFRVLDQIEASQRARDLAWRADHEQHRARGLRALAIAHAERRRRREIEGPIAEALWRLRSRRLRRRRDHR